MLMRINHVMLDHNSMTLQLAGLKENVIVFEEPSPIHINAVLINMLMFVSSDALMTKLDRAKKTLLKATLNEELKEEHY